jgi:hypothetical protein
MLAATLDDDRLSNPDSKKGKLQRAALRVLAEHERGHMLPTSIRFVFYELEQRGIVSKVKTGARRPDQDLIEAVTHLRKVGIVPWDWIVDETRDIMDPRPAKTIREGLIDRVETIRLNPWGRMLPPLTICESRSLYGVLEGLAWDDQASITSTNGQVVGHLETKVAPVFSPERHTGYLGDMDRAGGHIEQNTRRVLERCKGLTDRWERIAITREQIEERNLTPIIKHDDRYNDGGEHEAWETEALSQRAIVDLVRTWLDALLPEPLQRVLEREAAPATQPTLTCVCNHENDNPNHLEEDEMSDWTHGEVFELIEALDDYWEYGHQPEIVEAAERWVNAKSDYTAACDAGQEYLAEADEAKERLWAETVTFRKAVFELVVAQGIEPALGGPDRAKEEGLKP